ncbi:ThuA domain-containing protein [Sphingobacterium sp. UT-1RO-CII-1]|uniref:ThuA domain-containing protein n=1 Tax=Sphingobacterium sp. UT-1RO-CII-1 TaxID=2995225 RepID=UPI00227B4F36|nr:ThuA domain-containing protein [Sphingobacterium sp. UT-1RO-CII-1]MCY4778472.1 ThuA domain-containing protein [Sphingobacterium sp. UT-1RO-CII-1]
MIRIVFLFVFVCSAKLLVADSPHSPLMGKKVLVYTKNGEGFVHDNLKESADAIVKMGKEVGFEVDVYMENSTELFTDEHLSNYNLVVFANTNNEVFNSNEQRLAFRKFIQAGGGIVGIHSILGTERKWPWFNKLIGGSFVWHPKKQDLYLIKIKEHESTSQIPTIWQWEDECYFSREYYAGIDVAIVADLDKIDQADQQSVEKHKTSYGTLHPVVWSQKFDGGTSWVTTLGHNKEAYSDPLFLKHLLGGMEFVAKNITDLDYTKAYVEEFNEEVRYDFF